MNELTAEIVILLLPATRACSGDRIHRALAMKSACQEYVYEIRVKLGHHYS